MATKAEMDEEDFCRTEKRSLSSLIIHPGREPGVIDNDMIIRCIIAYGPTEEAGRLFTEEGVHFDEAPTVRLEFLNILRIDHLWMLTSLTKLTLAHNLIEQIENLELLTNLNELDLSFNKIEKIENVGTLVNLEIFTLFHNKIRKLENMEELEKLLVFSIGDNLIEDYKEVIYLRRFRFLRSVSFKGNPCCDDPMTNQFLWSALDRVTYLDYKLVTDEQRALGRSVFRSTLRQLDEQDETTEKKRVAKEEYDAQVKFYAMSFVEYLSGPELIISMFEKDPDGTVLLSYGGELLPYFEKYKENYVVTMSELVEFAQGAYTDRQNEIKLFQDLVQNALAESIEKSKVQVAAFEEKKKKLIPLMKDLVAKYSGKRSAPAEVDPKITELSEEYNDLVYELWKSLMTLEMRLFEQCEESRVQFAVNMQEKLTRLQEVSRNAFGAWREHEGAWSMKQFEILSINLGNTAKLLDAVPELVQAMSDRDLLMNLVAQSSDNHLRFIDAREDVLTTRSNDWGTDVMEGTTDKEIQRNRHRIMEINFYIDNQRAEWQDLQMGMVETVDPEAVALLGEDF